MTTARRLLLALFAAAPLAGSAADQVTPAVADAPYPLQIKVGESLQLCKTGTIQCPAAAALCDDGTLVQFELVDGGLAFRGVKAGETLCSAGSASGQGLRRVYRVTVSP
jgi:hypothetical protein